MRSSVLADFLSLQLEDRGGHKSQRQRQTDDSYSYTSCRILSTKTVSPVILDTPVDTLMETITVFIKFGTAFKKKMTSGLLHNRGWSKDDGLVPIEISG